MRIIHVGMLLVAMLVGFDCSPRRYSTKQPVPTSSAKGATTISFTSWLNTINTGSQEARSQSVSKLYDAFQSKDTSQEAVELRGGLGRLTGQVMRGETSPEQFESYCKTIETL